MLKLYNSLSRTKEEFKPIKEGQVKMYTCGPTVYWYAHIGNMRAYIFMDILRRVLKYNGYKVNGVMNITDVGHKTSDEDAGEDKMVVAATREHKSVYKIAEFYTKHFMEDIQALNIGKPEHIVKATEHIKEMQQIVMTLLKKSFAYELDDGIYFDVSKFPSYGSLSGIKADDRLAGARVEINEQKRNPADFALWKKAEPNHIMQWESPWGMGYPGWHIECSAMSRKYLGDHFDIHTGGIDHLTIHHENEIAQNDCSCGHKSVNYWIHSEFLLVDGGKMSKSLGNVYTVPELVSRGFKALDYRYFCLNTHYHNKLNFTFAGLDSAKIGYERLRNLVLLHKTGENKVNAETLEKYHALFLDAINDDLNLPKALGIVWEMLKTEEKSEDIYNLTVEFDSVFGLDLDKAEVENQKQEIPQIVVELANQRLLARKNKDFALSDKLREELKQNGYAVKDNALGYELTKI